MKLEKQACMLALVAILLLIVGAFVVGFPAGATLAEETDIDLNAFEGSVILDDPVYFQEATPDEPEVKPTQQPTIEPTQAPGEQPTVEPTHEPTAEPAMDAKFTVQITPPTGWRNHGFGTGVRGHRGRERNGLQAGEGQHRRRRLDGRDRTG